jgi:hypothetical protein
VQRKKTHEPPHFVTVSLSLSDRDEASAKLYGVLTAKAASQVRYSTDTNPSRQEVASGIALYQYMSLCLTLDATVLHGLPREVIKTLGKPRPLEKLTTTARVTQE